MRPVTKAQIDEMVERIDIRFGTRFQRLAQQRHAACFCSTRQAAAETSAANPANFNPTLLPEHSLAGSSSGLQFPRSLVSSPPPYKTIQLNHYALKVHRLYQD